MKKILFKALLSQLLIVFLFTGSYSAELIKPNKKLDPYDVVKIQLEALKNNDQKDQGIRQTWLFAHPDNKKATGPFARFRIMIYGALYRPLLNHSSHKINLLMNTPDKHIFKIEILTKEKKLFFYEWHVQKASEKNCNNCWFTSAVSIPVDQGNTI